MLTTVGKLLIDEALPPDLRDPARVLDKKGLTALLRDLARRHPEQYREVSHQLSQIGWRASQETGGFSFGLEHLRKSRWSKQMAARLAAQLETLLADDRLDDASREQKILQAVGQQLKEQPDRVYAESLAENNPLALQVQSGARGNKTNLTSLRGSDLLYVDQHNRLIPIPVLHSYSEGLTPSEFFAGTYGARKSVIDTKMSTAKAGYFGKQLAHAAHRLLVEDLDDPDDDGSGPLRGLPADSDDPDNEGALLAADAGPYKRNTVLGPKVLSHLRQLGVNRILVRSPIAAYSRNGGVYARDVGVRESGGLPGIGSQVGIAAAQAVAEPLSQGQLCLAKGTYVRMADSTVKPIEQIRVGDRVLGADRRGRLFAVTVLRTFDNGHKPCVHSVFRFHDSGGTVDLFSTADHKLLATTRQQAEDGTTQVTWGVVPVGGDYVELSAWIASDICPQERTRIILTPLTQQSPAGELETCDLMVDHPDHLFVLANGLIVSNSSKHSAGIAGGAQAVSGFDLLNQLVQVPKAFPGGAAHAQTDGTVARIEPAPAGGQYLVIDGQRHWAPEGAGLKVKVGDRVEAGDVLSEGLPNPAQIVRHKGIGEGRRYFVTAMRSAMRDAGIAVHRRNLELLSRGLINHVRLSEEMGDWAPDDVVPYHIVERDYRPRTGAVTAGPRELAGRYLEQPALHYSIGTRLTPSVLRELEGFKVKKVTAHEKPPPFAPEMIRGAATLSADPDWLVRFYGTGLKTSLLHGATRGQVADESGSSFVPSLARGVDFGRSGLVRPAQPDIPVKLAADGMPGSGQDLRMGSGQAPGIQPMKAPAAPKAPQTPMPAAQPTAQPAAARANPPAQPAPAKPAPPPPIPAIEPQPAGGDYAEYQPTPPNIFSQMALGLAPRMGPAGALALLAGLDFNALRTLTRGKDWTWRLGQQAAQQAAPAAAAGPNAITRGILGYAGNALAHSLPRPKITSPDTSPGLLNRISSALPALAPVVNGLLNPVEVYRWSGQVPRYDLSGVKRWPRAIANASRTAWNGLKQLPTAFAPGSAAWKALPTWAGNLWRGAGTALRQPVSMQALGRLAARGGSGIGRGIGRFVGRNLGTAGYGSLAAGLLDTANYYDPYGMRMGSILGTSDELNTLANSRKGLWPAVQGFLTGVGLAGSWPYQLAKYTGTTALLNQYATMANPSTNLHRMQNDLGGGLSPQNVLERDWLEGVTRDKRDMPAEAWLRLEALKRREPSRASSQSEARRWASETMTETGIRLREEQLARRQALNPDTPLMIDWTVQRPDGEWGQIVTRPPMPQPASPQTAVQAATAVGMTPRQFLSGDLGRRWMGAVNAGGPEAGQAILAPGIAAYQAAQASPVAPLESPADDPRMHSLDQLDR